MTRSLLIYTAIWLLFLAVPAAREVVLAQFRQLHSVSWRHIVAGLACGVVLVATDALALVVIGDRQPASPWRVPIAGFVQLLLWTAVVAVTEEMMIRGLLLTRLRAMTSDTAALMLTAAIFTVMHLGRADFGALSVIQYAIDGLLLGWITIRTGSIWAAAAFHFAKNFLVALLLGGSRVIAEPWLTTTGTPAELWLPDLLAYGIIVPAALLLSRRRQA
jgi:membrane protease YdiL (CAAX protease family)